MSVTEDLANALAGAIRAERRAQDLSQAEVFEPVGISKRAYITYENGTRDLSVPRLIAIASALNVSPADLFIRAQDAVALARPSFKCPSCGRTSHHPKDVVHGYCGACHDFTGKGSRL